MTIISKTTSEIESMVSICCEFLLENTILYYLYISNLEHSDIHYKIFIVNLDYIKNQKSK